MQQDKKQRFGPSALVVELNDLTERVANGEDAGVLDVLDKPMQERFQLTDQQRSELGALEKDPAAVARLKALVADAAKTGTARFVVLHRADKKSKGGHVHELVVQRAADRVFAAAFDDQALASPGGPPVTQLRIAHCNADCGDWGWG